jgi:hypothetical protein
MKRQLKLAVLRFAIRALLIAMAIGLPFYSLAINTALPPAKLAVEQKVDPAAASKPAPVPASPATSQPTPPSKQPENAVVAVGGASIEALSAFYQIVIGFLVTLLALVAGLAYWTVKLVSEAKAEEIAREAVRKMFADSREFQDTLYSAVDDALEDQLDDIRDRVAEMEERLAAVEDSTETQYGDEEDVPETEVVR